MRKHELVHLHALVRTVADHLIAVDALDTAALADYETLDVTPMSLQASRDDHRNALLSLTAAVAGDLSTDLTTDRTGVADVDVASLADAATRDEGPDDDLAAWTDGPTT